MLLEELRVLPAKHQTPLVLRYLEGQSRNEIAGRLVRGRRLLRSRLARLVVSLEVVPGQPLKNPGATGY